MWNFNFIIELYLRYLHACCTISLIYEQFINLSRKWNKDKSILFCADFFSRVPTFNRNAFFFHTCYTVSQDRELFRVDCFIRNMVKWKPTQDMSVSYAFCFCFWRLCFIPSVVCVSQPVFRVP